MRPLSADLKNLNKFQHVRTAKITGREWFADTRSWFCLFIYLLIYLLFGSCHSVPNKYRDVLLLVDACP